MANDFTLAGARPVIVHRQLTASGQYLPTSTAAQYADAAGAAFTDAGLVSEIAGVGANNGFRVAANVMVGVVFNGLSASSVELQQYVPSFTGGAAWKTVIPSGDWTDGQMKVIQGPLLPWRVGVVTYSTDTLYVTVWYMPAKDG